MRVEVQQFSLNEKKSNLSRLQQQEFHFISEMWKLNSPEFSQFSSFIEVLVVKYLKEFVSYRTIVVLLK